MTKRENDIFTDPVTLSFTATGDKTRETRLNKIWETWTSEGKMEWPDYEEVTLLYQHMTTYVTHKKSKILIKTALSYIIHHCIFIL